MEQIVRLERSPQANRYQLNHTTVRAWAGGTLAQRLSGKAELWVSHEHSPYAIMLRTGIVRGKGHTQIRLDVGVDDFRSLIDAMIKVDREKTLAAISSALHNGDA